jgi:hypothetical protein
MMYARLSIAFPALLLKDFLSPSHLLSTDDENDLERGKREEGRGR